MPPVAIAQAQKPVAIIKAVQRAEWYYSASVKPRKITGLNTKMTDSIKVKPFAIVKGTLNTTCGLSQHDRAGIRHLVRMSFRRSSSEQFTVQRVTQPTAELSHSGAQP